LLEQGEVEEPDIEAGEIEAAGYLGDVLGSR
jgi:hypothetical protein